MGHRQTYKEGSRTEGWIQENCHKIWDLQLQETKVTDGVYTRALALYRVLAADATIRYRLGGGVAIFIYHDDYPLPSQSLPAAWYKHGKIPISVMRTAMVHCIAEP